MYIKKLLTTFAALARSEAGILPIELLSPARDSLTAIEAIKCGADAVYIGAEKFGARSMAGNSVDSIRDVTAFAHQFGARVYATVNTIVYDHELADVERMIKRLYAADVDALIVQDMGILRLDIPPIALHSSTQCDLRTVEKARFLEAVGFSQLVLARELSKPEIAAIREATTVPLEAFVHGALCVSYSGLCQISHVLSGRSANRGECAQICRLPYSLCDDSGRVLLKDRHLLSLRDFNQSNRLAELLGAGVQSLKIEGRLKDVGYVKNVTAYYRQRLDAVIAQSAGRYVRSSAGRSEVDFTPDCSKSFNRQFTHYFFDERKPENGSEMASIYTPKSYGERIGRVLKCQGRNLMIESALSVHNGDGLSYLTRDGEYGGFRVNRAEGNRLQTANTVDIPRGSVLYRTNDKEHEDALNRAKVERRLWVDATLRVAGDCVSLELSDELGNNVVHALRSTAIAQSKSDQSEKQRQVLGKLGNTQYYLRNAETAGDVFVPTSELSALKRETLDLLSRATRITHQRPMRRAEDHSAVYPSENLDMRGNVANRLAREFYKEHGVKEMDSAIEVKRKADIPADAPLMTTRYCLRRELGACLKCGGAEKLPGQLFLQAPDGRRLRLEFHCTRCEMEVKV